MKNALYLILLLAACFSLISYSVCMAVHDDETLKSGDAWRSDITVGPGGSDSDDKIDESLRKAFKRSPIVIPPLNKDENADSGTEDPVNKKGSDSMNADDAGETGGR